MSKRRVFRFAPSPNGRLHLGHAYSALCNKAMAEECCGRLLLRMEDIDTERCTPLFEEQIIADLHWLNIEWEQPVRRQSDHFADYRAALDELRDMGLVYPACFTRSQIKDHVAEYEKGGKVWPRDPDGAPLYPGNERNLTSAEQQDLAESGRPFAWRLDMEAACARLGQPIGWREAGCGPKGETGHIPAKPQAWGDVILARKDTPTSYHLSVVVDDARQGVTDIVRGHDLFHATSVHRLLQALLGLPEPDYCHHALLVDAQGRKLSKSQSDTGIGALRDAGRSAAEVIRMCETGARI
ncbi:tRNA glutamyl-Q(34) synthetase GluQRS [Hoeflea prorocentri]|uniref:tRNA glutamyl-Q(34) synthetase GluQRS n=1 Tax=Hoeflea prorocentri TaxID=1922333 RepID=A0A9X3ZK53_9HYPH|nr:tRNA glutamyl-Q(34) synthetase GluQRS [Hoeflea prorocentri]MCY6383656.1 tRNA glutamyl-Q(34) synthetase GluQRS [Hoeflea prorocentri]MDA5401456.1 tRNA glutamyl-Q(34) synthetase GluQRS [Hoeflea prorocentri]